jgi:hypothetical protein
MADCVEQPAILFTAILFTARAAFMFRTAQLLCTACCGPCGLTCLQATLYGVPRDV